MKNIIKNSKIVLISTISATMTACQSMGTSGITERDTPPKQLYSVCTEEEKKEYDVYMQHVERFPRLQLFAISQQTNGCDRKITEEDIETVHNELKRKLPELFSGLDDATYKYIVQSSSALVMQKLVPQIKDKEGYKDAQHFLAVQLYHPNVKDAETWEVIRAGKPYFVSPAPYVGPSSSPTIGTVVRIGQYTKVKVEEERLPSRMWPQEWSILKNN